MADRCAAFLAGDVELDRADISYLLKSVFSAKQARDKIAQLFRFTQWEFVVRGEGRYGAGGLETRPYGGCDAALDDP